MPNQLALLLIARYHVDDNQLSPTFQYYLSFRTWRRHDSSYESQPVGKTITTYLYVLSGTININTPDIVLFSNHTSFSLLQKSHSQFANFKILVLKNLLPIIKTPLIKGPVSIMDIHIMAPQYNNTLMRTSL